jgi:hypothetical protein
MNTAQSRASGVAEAIMRLFDELRNRPGGVLMGQVPRSRRRRLRIAHPMMFEEIAHMGFEEGDEPMSLLVLAGLLRDDFPWLSEIIIEVYREQRTGDSKVAQRGIERLRRIMKGLRRGPLMEELAGSSKEAHMMMMELPMMLDHFLHRLEVRRHENSDADSIEPAPPAG